jgi:hypothetical protein
VKSFFHGPLSHKWRELLAVELFFYDPLWTERKTLKPENFFFYDPRSNESKKECLMVEGVEDLSPFCDALLRWRLARIFHWWPLKTATYC